MGTHLDKHGMMRTVSIGALMAIASYIAPASASSSEEDVYAPGRAIVADIHRVVIPNGIQETFEVKLGGTRQVVNARGADRNNPILIYVHGGPGSVEMPMSWTFQRHWEDFFTVVQWDQRGAGKSFPLNDPDEIAPTLTLERYRDDAIELILLLCKRYGKKKVFLLGHSWGSAVGLSVAMKRPDLLHAYIGMGQLIDVRENERVGFNWALERAEKEGNQEAIRALKAMIPYPGKGPLTIKDADAWRKWAIGWGSLAAHRSDADFYFNSARLSPQYTPDDIRAWGQGSDFTVQTLLPRLSDMSFKSVRKLDVPIVLFHGRHDHTTEASIAENWMSHLSAPVKTMVWFEHSAHLPMISEPGRVLKALLDHVYPLAGRNAGGEK